MLRAVTISGCLATLVSSASGGTLIGKVELPPAPERPKVGPRGFVDRAENARKPVQPANVGAQLLVVLEGESKESSGQVNWDVVGESFSRPVLAVAVGSEVVIRNQSKVSRTLVAAEDPKLIAAGPLNPTGPKNFKVTAPRIYTISDPDAPYLRGKLVVVPTTLIAYVEVAGAVGKFEITDVPEGTYKLRVFYRDNWIDRPDDTVTMGAGPKKVEVTVKLPAGYPLKK